ncbi:MAG: TadE/TadG family type IV pilus assembly protein [Holosporales bacterium]|jgi:Flp pilus assembly protein TadG
MMKIFQYCQKFFREKKGFTFIEAAIILPVLVFFAIGVLEAALAIQQKAAVTRAVKAVGAGLQENPTQSVSDLLSGLDVKLLNFDNVNACVCATVHSSAADAEVAAKNRGCPCASTNTNLNALVRPFFLGVSASATLPAATGLGGKLFGNPRVLQSHTVLSFPVGQEDCYIIHTTTLMDPSDSDTGFFIKEIKHAWEWGYDNSGTFFTSSSNPFAGPPLNMGTNSSTGEGPYSPPVRSCPKGTLVTGLRVDYGRDENPDAWTNGQPDSEFADQGVAELTCKPSIPIKILLCAKGNKARPYWNPKTDAEMDARIRSINPP